mmetsp:Transcript_62572/g.182957  ORF Transcript_62572/g.182957 Transcript_62572/m.182957 type:complete len:269 (-) Transcript_62572:66-872(-)
MFSRRVTGPMWRRASSQIVGLASCATAKPPPRLAAIHAMQPSVTPTVLSFQQHWQEVDLVHVLDDSLARDVTRTGIDSFMTARFLALAEYARDGAKCDGLLFTCSAFGSAIEAVKEKLQTDEFPILKPNEAMMEDAVKLARSSHHGQVGLIVVLSMFEPTLPSIVRELTDIGGSELRLMPRFVPGAMQALQAGDEARCIELIAEAAEAAVQEVRIEGEEPACVAFAMFSMARARRAAEARISALGGDPPPVLTSPDSAVLRMRALLGF